MRVIHVTQSGSGVTGGRRTQVIVSRTGPQGPAGGGAGSVALDDLTDVSLVGTTSGDFLRYNGTAWTDTKIVASDLGTGTADTYHFLAGDLTWQDAVPLDVSAKNTTASTIAKGTPVYITGSVGSGHTVEVAPADASSSGTMSSIGLTVTELAAGATGYVRTMGVLENVSTGAYSINQTLFVASGGGLTNTRPTGNTTLVQNIGRVMRANNNTGTVLILGPGRVNDVPNRIGTTYLADGTAGASNYLRGDQTWSTISAADVGAAPTSRNLTASTGLSGGGDLSADRSFSVLYGTTAGTAAQGNDTRITGAAQKAANLSDLASTSTARTNLGITTVATDTIFDAVGDLAVGTGADASARLAKGTQGQVLAVGSSTLGYISAPPQIGGYAQPTSSDHSTFGITSTIPAWAGLGNQTAPTSGRIVLVPIELDVNLTISAIAFTSGTTAGASLTNQWFVLCNSAKLALAYTTNDTTTAWGTSTRKQLSLTSSYTTTYRGRHYLGILVTATTVPTLRGQASTGGGVQPWALSADTGLTTPGTAGTTSYTGAALSAAVYYAEVV